MLIGQRKKAGTGPAFLGFLELVTKADGCAALVT